MAKKDFILTPQNIANIGSVDFVIDTDGKLTAINVTCEVNYGTEGRNTTIDLLPNLSQGQKGVAQGFYDNLKKILERVILG